MTCVVFVQYCHNSSLHPLFDTKIALPPAFWNRKKQCIIEGLPERYGDPAQLNPALQHKCGLVEDILCIADKYSLPGKSFVKENILGNAYFSRLSGIESKLANKYNKLNLDLYFQIDDCISSKLQKVCKDMLRIYRNMKEHLFAFEEFRKKPLQFDNLDFSFYEEFVDFMFFNYKPKRRTCATPGLKTNTVGKRSSSSERFYAIGSERE